MTDFAAFWEAVPPRKKIARHACEKKFASVIKQKLATAEQMVASMEAYAAHVKAKGTEDRFVCHPLTWLNQGRWDGVYDTSAPHHGDGLPVEKRPSYLCKDRAPKASPEGKKRAIRRAEIHDVMRARGLNPYEMPRDAYDAVFQEIAATIQPGERA